MKKLVTLAGVLVLAGAVAASAAASLRTYIVDTKYVGGAGNVGTVSGTVKKPYKIILYCEGVNARCSSSVVCVRGAKEFTQTRSGLAPGTWNLKKRTWYRMDSCRLRATVRSGAASARATVQATVRS